MPIGARVLGTNPDSRGWGHPHYVSGFLSVEQSPRHRFSQNISKPHISTISKADNLDY